MNTEVKDRAVIFKDKDKEYTEEKIECKASHDRIVKLKENLGISSVHP